MAEIAVMIPTFRRPESLARALCSVFDQEGAASLIGRIVVVDNAPEGSARALVESLQSASPAELVYVHEPRPGVATARNAGLQAMGSAAYVAFLDDDEAATPDWLAQLFATHQTCAADVTFGPVEGVAPDAPAWAKAYLERFFSREGPGEPGLTEEVYGCGNSMMTRATALAGPAPFDTGTDQVGGEDDHLFQRLKQQGARFAWAASARVLEYAPAHRATMAYALARAFSYGQTPARLCADRTPRDWPGIVRWMAVGALQFGVFGAAAAALWMCRAPARAPMADRAARGLGKLIWWRTPRFYGAALANRTPVPA